MSNASLFKIINCTTEISGAALSRAWANTLGEVNNCGSFSNMDTRNYFEAVCTSGEVVRCSYILNDAATIVHAEHHPSSQMKLGTTELPRDWTEVRLVSFYYQDPKNLNNRPIYPEGVTVARRNDDGTAQIYKTHY